MWTSWCSTLWGPRAENKTIISIAFGLSPLTFLLLQLLCVTSCIYIQYTNKIARQKCEQWRRPEAVTRCHRSASPSVYTKRFYYWKMSCNVTLSRICLGIDYWGSSLGFGLSHTSTLLSSQDNLLMDTIMKLATRVQFVPERMSYCIYSCPQA
jgi:hypothetical protein